MLFPPTINRSRFGYHHLLCLLDTVHHLLMIAISRPRQFSNLVHWLPLALSIQGALSEPGESRSKDEADQSGMSFHSWRKLKQLIGNAATTHDKDVTLVIQALADTMFYWSLLKISAKVVLIVTTLPYAFVLITIPRQPYYYETTLQIDRWLHIAVPLFATLIVGIGLLETPKMDAYSFGHLAIAVAGRMIPLCPTWIIKAQLLFRTASHCLSNPLAIQLVPLKAIKNLDHRVSTSLFGFNNPLIEYLNRLATSVHLQTTALLFLLDGISQWPKRWSFPVRGCWSLAGGVLLLHGMRLSLSRKKAEPDTKERDSSAKVDTCLKNDNMKDVIKLGLKHCISSLLAITIITSLPSLVGTGSSATIYHASASVHGLYRGLITLSWTSLWVSTNCTNTVQRKLGSADARSKVSPDERKAEDRSTKESRWFKKTLLGLSAVPLMLATVKHGLSGNTLAIFSKQVDKLVSVHHSCTFGY